MLEQESITDPEGHTQGSKLGSGYFHKYFNNLKVICTSHSAKYRQHSNQGKFGVLGEIFKNVKNVKITPFFPISLDLSLSVLVTLLVKFYILSVIKSFLFNIYTQ